MPARAKSHLVSLVTLLGLVSGCDPGLGADISLTTAKAIDPKCIAEVVQHVPGFEPAVMVADSQWLLKVSRADEPSGWYGVVVRDGRIQQPRTVNIYQARLRGNSGQPASNEVVVRKMYEQVRKVTKAVHAKCVTERNDLIEMTCDLSGPWRKCPPGE